ARETARHRAHLAAALAALPDVEVHQPAAGPFLLLRVRDGEQVRAGLRRRGIAVRRGDTFPGLSADHLRVAVRDPARTARLVDALRAELSTEVLT
ncbi:MAG: Rv2231c family pyridoxal phosphate-dependent protein CobC, partial [Actinophytocola sp.]